MAKHLSKTEVVEQLPVETVEQLPAEIAEQLLVEASAAASAASVATEGVRARRAFMPKLFIPSADWINTEVVSQGKGTRATLGRVYGSAFETIRKSQTLPNGAQSETIAIKGIFQAEDYRTGEISEASMLYLPMSYAEKLEGVFKALPDAKMIEVDCDIGIEATGKPIPYEWVITAFREGAEMEIIKRLRNSRARPTNLLLTPTGK